MPPMTVPLRVSLGSEDARMVACIREGDASAYETMFRAYAPGLYTLACRIAPSPPEAEELVHDVMLSVWKQRATWNPYPSVKAYLVRAVQNRGLMRCGTSEWCSDGRVRYKPVTRRWQRPPMRTWCARRSRRR